jgi:hypothetical protein
MKASGDRAKTASRAEVDAQDAEESEGIARFLRGLTLGALVGAAIAGSAIWQRARARNDRTTTDAPTEHDHPTGDVDRL